MLLGFAAALRRAEIASLDIVEHPAGLEIHVRRSKTDQNAEGGSVPGQAQSGLQLEAQLAKCTNACAARDWTVASIASDEG